MLISIFGNSELLFQGTSARIICLIRQSTVVGSKGFIFHIFQLQLGTLDIK